MEQGRQGKLDMSPQLVQEYNRIKQASRRRSWA
jgi:hypothetical protein